jgi:hypothetical protein
MCPHPSVCVAIDAPTKNQKIMGSAKILQNSNEQNELPIQKMWDLM